MANINPYYTNNSKVKTEFASKGSVSKKKRKSYSSRTNNVRSIIDTSNLYLVRIEIKDTSNNITYRKVRN